MIRVLVAEDEPVMQRLLVELLRRRGFDATACADGRSALAALPRIDPDVLVTDLRMPMLDGEGLCRAVREHPRYAGIPIIVTTAFSLSDDRVRRLARMAGIRVLSKSELSRLPRIIEETVPALDGAVTIRAGQASDSGLVQR